MKVPEPLAGRIGLCCQLGGSPAFFLTKKYFLSANYDKSLTTKLFCYDGCTRFNLLLLRVFMDFSKTLLKKTERNP